MIIPSINAQTFSEAKELIKKAEEFLPPGGWIHIDVADGKFSPYKTWGNPEEFKEITGGKMDEPGKPNFEIHLMVQNPELVIENWVSSGAKRVIVHHEAISDPETIQDQPALAGAEAMIAINPETPVNELKQYLSDFKGFQILAVKPGPAGQEFNQGVLEKIASLRALAPRAKIEVDGGITPETARAAKAVGADFFVSAHYLWGSSNPAQAYQELLKAISNQ